MLISAGVGGAVCEGLAEGHHNKTSNPVSIEALQGPGAEPGWGLRPLVGA